jgi:hypothetical protein
MIKSSFKNSPSKAVLPTNTRPGCKSLPLTNALAFFGLIVNERSEHRHLVERDIFFQIVEESVIVVG